MLKFEELQLKAEILQAVEDMGFEEATPIQELAIPIAITGKDVIGQAQTGTGKTAAFSIPLLEMIDEEEVVQALILTPTRELCIQVEKEIHKLCRYLNIRSVAVYGGQEIIRQIKALKAKPQIIVATPGRLLDHMERHTIKLQNLKFVVLDEADEMLNMGFLEDIEKILSACPEPRQMMMFSATMRKEIQEIANKFMHEPELVKVKATELTVPAIEQHYYEVMESKKFALLCRLLDIYHPELAMVFGRTKRRVDEVTEALQKLGYQAEGLHGDLTQRHRDMVMNKFRNGQISILVATDVAARGLDISGVTHVINFDLPQDIDSYVHRIGRTGRAGKEGLAMTFVEPREFPHLKSIETTIKRKIDKKKAPTFQDAQEKKQEQMYHAIRRVIEEEKYDGYRDMASDLLEQYDSLDLVAALLELTAGDDDHEQEIKKIKISAERPIMIKRVQSKKTSGKNSSKNTSRKENTGGFDKFRKDKQKPYYEAKAEANKKSKKSAKKDVKKDAKKDVKKDQKSNKKDKQKADNQ